jgi:hypothetical protein
MRQSNAFEDWPDYVQQVFLAVGKAMASRQLHPEDLDAIPTEVGTVVPGHLVRVVHVSGAQLGKRKGRYKFTIEGPRISGAWAFQSGELQRLSLAALESSAPTKSV